MRIPVSKYHGCGNDFVIASMNDLQGIDLSHLATAVCDRHTDRCRRFYCSQRTAAGNDFL